MRPDPVTSAFHAASDVAGHLSEQLLWPRSRGEALAAMLQVEATGAVLEPKIKRRLEYMKKLAAQANSGPPPQGAFVTAVAPTIPNVVRTRPRYFRAVVWNLENFTHDPRPAGTTAISSMRNQARMVIAADFAFRLGADVLLLMETGGDVGQAMTQMAKLWQDKESNSPDTVKRSVEPLVSGATHGLPEMELTYSARAYPATADAVHALMLAGEGYGIVPTQLPGVTLQIAQAALNLLWESSGHLREISVRPQNATTIEGMLLAWARWCWEGFLHAGEGTLPQDEDTQFIARLLQSMLQSPAQFLTQPETDLGEVLWALRSAREIVEEAKGATVEAAVAHVVQMLLLVWLLYRRLGTTEERPTLQRGELPPVLLHSQQPFWLNAYGEPGDVVALSLFVAAAQPLTLSAHDHVNGAITTASDGELLLYALERLNLVAKPHAETYGIVYRPYSPNHLQAFFNQGCEDLGYNTEGLYGILHGDRAGNLVVSQTPGGVLAGRSALKISFPISADLWVPFLMHHNRYSGSAAISTRHQDYSKEINTIMARLETLADEARLVSLKDDPPLIVGDFNLTEPYVQAEPPSRHKVKEKRKQIREAHQHELGKAGYFRRSKADYTHPKTTLKRLFNIAKGEVFSEPYDAVYQPFDFLFGEMEVRAAAVQDWAAFFPASLLNDQVTYAKDVNSQQTDPIGKVLHDQILRNYQSLVLAIVIPMFQVRPWVELNLGGLADQWKTLIYDLRRELDQRSGLFLQSLSANLYAPVDTGHDTRKAIQYCGMVGQEFKRQKAAKAKAKREEKKEQARIEAERQRQADLLASDGMDDIDLDALEDDEADTESEAPQAAVKGKRAKKSPEARVAEMPDTFGALLNFERQPNLRFWSAYTAIVSDHLPVLVEVEDVV